MYDVVVIGLGGVGSFALRALAKGGEGKKILGIERFHRLHKKGSSHGETRIFRKAYFEDERYIDWVDYSIQEFEVLEKESGTSLINKCGNLILQDKPNENDGDKNESNNANYLQLAMEAAQKHGVEVEFLNQEALQKRYPQFNYSHKDTELIGLLEPGAGLVRPVAAVSAALSQAESHDNVTIWEHSIVKSLKEVPDSTPTDDLKRPCVELKVELENTTEEEETKEITITSKTVLITAGAWAPQLIPSWSKYLTVTRQTQGWVDVKYADDANIYMPHRLPTWILTTKNYHLPFFGAPVDTKPLPEDANDKLYAKVGIHNHTINIIDDPSFNPALISDTEKEEYKRAVKVAFNDTAWGGKELSTDNIRVIPCMYTNTPDENILIGVPREFTSVYAVAGLSGHGFKMTPALGQMLADFALIGEEALNAKWQPDKFCNASRFDS